MTAIALWLSAVSVAISLAAIALTPKNLKRRDTDDGAFLKSLDLRSVTLMRLGYHYDPDRDLFFKLDRSPLDPARKSEETLIQ